MSRCVFGATGIVQRCVFMSVLPQGEACALPVVLVICIVALFSSLSDPCIIRLVILSPARWWVKAVHTTLLFVTQR